MVALDLREMHRRERANWSCVLVAIGLERALDQFNWSCVLEQLANSTHWSAGPQWQHTEPESLREQIESELEAIQQELEPTDKSCRRRKSLRLRTSWVVAVPKST